MTTHAHCTTQQEDSTPTDEKPSARRCPGEVVNLDDRRFARLVAAARMFLDQSRSFGWGPRPPRPSDMP